MQLFFFFLFTFGFLPFFSSCTSQPPILLLPWFQPTMFSSSSSFSLTPKEGTCNWGLVLLFLEKRKRSKIMQVYTYSYCSHFWKEEGSPSLSLLYLYSLLNEVGCLGAEKGCSYPIFGLSWVGFYSNSPLG